jgi:very-short-patch-repair endonuclease
MRRNPTEPEKRLWRVLSNAQLGGFKFRRQTVIGHYIADFVCAQKALVVEVDGDTHADALAESRRDAALAGFGYAVLHATNADVMANIEGVRGQLLATLQTLPNVRTPHPNPSPEGEGVEAVEAGIRLEGSVG